VGERGDAGVGLHHEALAVIERRGGEVRTPDRVAVAGPGGVADEDVDLACLEGDGPLLGADGTEVHCVCVSKDCGGDGTAHVHVEAADASVRFDIAEIGNLVVDSADKGTAYLYLIQQARLSTCQASEQCGCGGRYYDKSLHWFSTPSLLHWF